MNCSFSTTTYLQLFIPRWAKYAVFLDFGEIFDRLNTHMALKIRSFMRYSASTEGSEVIHLRVKIDQHVQLPKEVGYRSKPPETGNKN